MYLVAVFLTLTHKFCVHTFYDIVYGDCLFFSLSTILCDSSVKQTISQISKQNNKIKLKKWTSETPNR